MSDSAISHQPRIVPRRDEEFSGHKVEDRAAFQQSSTPEVGQVPGNLRMALLQNLDEVADTDLPIHDD
jgi:hypothetical protein